MSNNKIIELSLNDLTIKFGNITNIIELSQLGTKNMKDVIELKNLIISKINKEISEYNFLSAQMTDVGMFFTKNCLRAGIFISINKEEVSENLKNIFININDLNMFIYRICDEHNNKSKKMTILPHFNQAIRVVDDNLLINLTINIF